MQSSGRNRDVCVASRRTPVRRQATQGADLSRFRWDPSSTYAFVMAMRRLETHRGTLIDAALAAGVMVVMAAAISARLGQGRPPDLIAYLFAVGLGILMLIRRRYPVLALVATA